MNESDPYTISFPVKASVSTKDLKDKHGFRTELSQMAQVEWPSDTPMPQPKAPSVTTQNMQYLSDNLQELHSVVETLYVRLATVLTDSSPSPTQDKKAYNGNNTLNEALASYCRQIDDVIDNVRALTARIDL